MVKVVIIAIILSFSNIVFAKECGYGKTVWGMKLENVIDVERDVTKVEGTERYVDGIGKAQKEFINIGGSLYTAIFIFNDKDQLVQVDLVSRENRSKAITSAQFNYLYKILTLKYGNPSFKKEKNIVWKTRDTTIELMNFYIKGVEAKTVVRYMPTRKFELEMSKL